jgi:hypothetical protein
MADVTRLLNAAASGDPRAATVLLPLVYDELRKLAAARTRSAATASTSPILGHASAASPAEKVGGVRPKTW